MVIITWLAIWSEMTHLAVEACPTEWPEIKGGTDTCEVDDSDNGNKELTNYSKA